MMTISITIDEPLVKAIDRVARESKRTRSEVCRIALRRWLQSLRESQMVSEEQVAYRAHPVAPGEFDDLIAAQTIHALDEEDR